MPTTTSTCVSHRHTRRARPQNASPWPTLPHFTATDIEPMSCVLVSSHNTQPAPSKQSKPLRFKASSHHISPTHGHASLQTQRIQSQPHTTDDFDNYNNDDAEGPGSGETAWLLTYMTNDMT
eukprot:3809199-Amphidinium_carterae.1